MWLLFSLLKHKRSKKQSNYEAEERKKSKSLAISKERCNFAADFDFDSEMTMNNSQKETVLPIKVAKAMG